MEWKNVRDYENYQVSNTGLVRIIVGGRHKSDGELLKASNVGGYLCVTLFNGVSKKMLKVHRLVAQSFLPPPENSNQIQVAHNDGNPKHNKPINLRWATSKENLSDRINHGTALDGSRNGRAKLTEAQVLEIRRRYKPRCKQNGANVLAREFGVTDVAIIKAFRGENWSQTVMPHDYSTR